MTTTNKGPLALYSRELIAIAHERGLQFLYEGTVMAGTPLLNLIRETLAGATILNAVKVEDLMVRQGRVAGLVVNWTPVVRLEMHVDPLVVAARAVIDGTGHPSEVATMATRKAGLPLDTPNGGVIGEKPMWMEIGERTTVENTKRLCPGLYAAGMAANNIQGGFRMGPIFGGMLKSGRRVATIVAEDLKA